MRVYNVPSSAPFLRTVITALVDGRLIEGFSARENPERLLTATLYLPTQRACRMAREVFLDVIGKDAALLPRIAALGNVDEDQLDFASVQGEASAPDLPPALSPMERRFILAQLVGRWTAQLRSDDPLSAPLVDGGPAVTLALADDLGRLIDDITTRGVSWDALDGLVPNDLDNYWQLTLRFLQIAKDWWPQFLADNDQIESAARRDLLIAAEAARLATHDGPVIAAGSTGSMPATAKFLHAIAAMKNGAVVLPGLDVDLDNAAWQSIGGERDAAGRFIDTPLPSHPQFALHGLLQRFGIDRSEVIPLAEPSASGREILMSEAMRPAGATAEWQSRLQDRAVTSHIAAASDNLSVIEAPNSEAEALAIAVAMRESRQLGKSAALVTPDRALARRVMAALGRWNLVFDDSGGDRLTDAPAGVFARLAATTVADEFAPATLLALLKHPFFRLGQAENFWANAVRHLELTLLRGTRPPPGSEGLRNAFDRFRGELAKLRRNEPSALHASDACTRISDDDLDRIADFLAKLRDAFAPLEQLGRGKKHDIATLAMRHRKVLLAMAADDEAHCPLFEDRSGQQLSSAFDELFTPTKYRSAAPDGDYQLTGIAAELSDYPEVFTQAFSDRTVRRPQIADAHLRIYGPLEARLTHCDRVILGGLVEDVWPPAPQSDPWLSRPMRHDLGLDLPERRVGLSAHDFAQMMGIREVVLSHAAKVGGSPAVPSRFLHRIEAVMGADNYAHAKHRGEQYLQWAHALDQPAQVKPIAQPQPKPALALRPLRMSVTEIEDWLRDPYTIFAKRILRLLPLDPVDMPLTTADRGSAIHDTLGEFTQKYPEVLPPDIAAELQNIGTHHFAALMQQPEARALWWPRFLRIASWFAGWETSRRLNANSVDSEISGRISLPLGHDREFLLTARADRIEHRSDRTYVIVDYKTGQVPSDKQVRLGLSPQLTLEAAILRGGGFKGIANGTSVSELVYVKLSGNNPAGKEQVVKLSDKKEEWRSPDEAADEALHKLKKLIRRFDNPDQAYTSLDLAMWSNRYGAYDDLARIKEWSAAGLGGEAE